MAFAYALLVGLLVQLAILPYLLPQWHAGSGLLESGDWLMRHARAAEMAARVRTQGWSAWRLVPEGDGSVGIAAAIYALTTPKPWTLLPINAALHATATLALVLILTPLLGSRRRAAISSLPFLLCPTALLWTTQILKDSYSVAGFMLFLLGWVRLTSLALWHNLHLRKLVTPLVAIVTGGFLMGLVRAYMLQMLQMATACLAAPLVLVLLWQRIRARLRWSSVVTGAVALAGAVLILSAGTQLGGSAVSWESSSLEGVKPEIPAPESPLPSVSFRWTPSSFLPRPADLALKALARERQAWRVLFGGAASNMDENVGFESAGDVLAYAPRALQVALLAPFPSQWRAPGASTVATFFRRENAAEMVVIYVLLAFLPAAIWRWRQRVELWVLLLLCLGMLLAFGESTINLGTLHRIRYPYLMTLACLGLGGGLTLLRGLRSAKGRERRAPRPRAP